MDHAIFCPIHFAHYRLRQYLRHAHKKVPLICEKHLPTTYSVPTPLARAFDRQIAIAVGETNFTVWFTAAGRRRHSGPTCCGAW